MFIFNTASPQIAPGDFDKDARSKSVIARAALKNGLMHYLLTGKMCTHYIMFTCSEKFSIITQLLNNGNLVIVALLFKSYLPDW